MTEDGGGRDAPTPVVARREPVHRFAGRVHEVLDELTAGGVPVLGLSGPEAAESVVELLRAAARLEGLALAVLAQADRTDVAEEVGATSTAAWLAHAARVPHPRARRLTRLAGRLADPSAGATADALLAGDVDVAQAEVVVDAVGALPERLVTPADRCRAERHLLAEARHHDARRLQLLGRHLLAVIDPQAADIELGKRLEADERQAAARTFLKLRDDGAGTCSGSFRIPVLQGAMLTKALQALASPARPDAIPRTATTRPDASSGGAEDDANEPTVRPRLHAELLGEAFCEYIERFPAEQVPTAGGVNATVVVTVTLDAVLSGLGAAGLDLGGEVSAGCSARPSAWRSGSATAAAPRSPATGRPAGATPTTRLRGRGAGAPTSRPVGCSVHGTTGSCTTRATGRQRRPAARCGSPGCGVSRARYL